MFACFISHMFSSTCSLVLSVLLSLCISLCTCGLCSLHLCVCTLGRKPLFRLIELNIRGFCNPFLSFHNFRTKNNHLSNGFGVKYLSSSFFFCFLAQILSRPTYWVQNLNDILPQTVHIRFARSY